jgi:hypothetical protein
LNNYRKIIGGYNPNKKARQVPQSDVFHQIYPYSYGLNNSWQSDRSGAVTTCPSFLFSLTTNNKFAQKKDKNIPLCGVDNKELIKFGSQFYICSNSNTQQSAAFSLKGSNYDCSYYHNY